MEFYFRFSSNDNNRLMERRIIVDGISFDKIWTSISRTVEISFMIFPNPTNQILNFSVGNFAIPSSIHKINIMELKFLNLRI